MKLVRKEKDVDRLSEIERVKCPNCPDQVHFTEHLTMVYQRNGRYIRTGEHKPRRVLACSSCQQIVSE